MPEVLRIVPCDVFVDARISLTKIRLPLLIFLPFSVYYSVLSSNSRLTQKDRIKFKEDFNMTRNDEPGMSIVFPDICFSDDSENEGAEFNQRNLVRKNGLKNTKMGVYFR